MNAASLEAVREPWSSFARNGRPESYSIEFARSAGRQGVTMHWTRGIRPRRAQKAASIFLDLPIHEPQPSLSDGISNSVPKQAILHSESTVSRAVPARPDPAMRRRNGWSAQAARMTEGLLRFSFPIAPRPARLFHFTAFFYREARCQIVIANARQSSP